MDDRLFTIDLPIYPKDIFRLLALRSVCTNEKFLAELSRCFAAYEQNIGLSERLLNRKKPFDYASHGGLNVKKKFSAMTERQLCASRNAFFRQDRNFKHIGHVIDYEVPLDDARDSAAGKIDLLSVAGNTAFVIEVKKFDSNEYPIRALFEVFTFWKMIGGNNPEKFRLAYRNKAIGYTGLPPECSVVPALLLGGKSKILDRVKKHEQWEICKLFYARGVRVFEYDDQLNVKEVEEVKF